MILNIFLSLQKMEKKNIEIIYNNNNNNLNNIKIKKDSTVISGSNYNNIVPEIGVRIKEDDKSKSGGENFHNQFGRMSLKEYEMLREKYAKGYNNNNNNYNNNNYNNNNNNNDILNNINNNNNNNFENNKKKIEDNNYNNNNNNINKNDKKEN